MKFDRIALWIVLLAPPSVVVTFEPRGLPFQKPWRTQHKFQQQRQHQQQRQQQRAASSGVLLRAGEQDAADAAGGGLAGSASGLPLLIGPVAALAAGRQALQNRQVIKEEVKETEEQLERVKQSLLTSDRLITASFSLAAITSIASLGVIFASPPPAAVQDAASSSSSTVVSSSASPVAVLEAPKIAPLVSLPDVPTQAEVPTLPTPLEVEKEKSTSAFRFKQPTAKVAEPEAVVVPEPQAEPQASAYSSLMDKLFTEKKEEPVDEAAAPEAVDEAAAPEAEDVVATEPEKPAATALIDFLTKKPGSEEPSNVVPAPVMPEVAKAPEVKAEEKDVKEDKGSSLLEFLTKKAEVEEPAIQEKDEKKSILDSLSDKIEKPTAPEDVEEKKSFFGMRKVEEAPAVEEEKKSVFGALMDRLPGASVVEEKEEPKSVFGSFLEKLELPAELGADPIVVGAVGVAALGVFAALLAADDDFSGGSGGKATGSGSYLDSLNSNKYGSISGSGPQSTGASYLGNLSGKTGPASYADKLSGGSRARVKPSSIKRTVRTSGMVGSSTGYMDSLASGRVAPMKSSTPPRPAMPPPQPPQKPTMEKKADAKPNEEEDVEEAIEVEAPEPEVVVEETPGLVEAKLAGSGSYLDRLTVPAAGTVTPVKSYGPSKWSPSKSTGGSTSSGSNMGSYLDNIVGPSQEGGPSSSSSRTAAAEVLPVKKSYGPSKWSPSKSNTSSGGSTMRSYLDIIDGQSQEGGDASSTRTAAEELPSINELAEQRGKEEQPSIR